MHLKGKIGTTVAGSALVLGICGGGLAATIQAPIAQPANTKSSTHQVEAMIPPMPCWPKRTCD
jgi:fucose permease